MMHKLIAGCLLAACMLNVGCERESANQKDQRHRRSANWSEALQHLVADLSSADRGTTRLAALHRLSKAIPALPKELQAKAVPGLIGLLKDENAVVPHSSQDWERSGRRPSQWSRNFFG